MPGDLKQGDETTSPRVWTRPWTFGQKSYEQVNFPPSPSLGPPSSGPPVGPSLLLVQLRKVRWIRVGLPQRGFRPTFDLEKPPTPGEIPRRGLSPLYPSKR